MTDPHSNPHTAPQGTSNDATGYADGRCHCGAIHYTMPLAVHHHSLCHCRDCQRHSGAPLVGWALVDADALSVTGTPAVYASSEHGRRHFCSACGTGLFYTNDAVFPGMIDVQSTTLDDPSLLPPQIQIQTAERQSYMEDLNTVPAFDRYPPEAG